MISLEKSKHLGGKEILGSTSLVLSKLGGAMVPTQA
jgi:hypothetical protein